jgi:uncharacterized membrane protein
LKLGRCLKLLCIAAAFILLRGSVVQAEEIKLTRDTIYADILHNGNIQISEELAYKISGKYNGVFKDISYDKADSVNSIAVYEISDTETPYKEVKSANNGAKGVFTVEKKDSSSLRIKIFSPSKDETKSFRVEYKLQGAVKRYKDVGEFYWKFIGKENETPIERLQINVRLPEGATKDQIKVFGHGSLEGNWLIIDDRIINFYVQNLAAGRYVEVRTIFPEILLAGMKVTSDENKLQGILTQEQGYISEKVEAQKNKEEFIQDSKAPVLIMSLLNIILVLFIAAKYKYPKDVDELIAMKDISNYNPALLASNAKIGIGNNELMASILELVRRGYLGIEREDGDYRIAKLKNKEEGLEKHEVYLIHWLIDIIGNRSTVTFKEISTYGLKRANDFRRQFALWRGEVILQVKNSKLTNRKAQIAQNIASAAGLGIAVISLVIIIIGSIYGLISFIVSVLMFIPIFMMNTRNLEGLIQYRLYKNMKNKLKNLRKSDIDALVENNDLGSLYVIYAVAMGLRKDLIDKISPYLSSDGNYSDSSFWLMYYLISSDSGNFNESFDESFKYTGYSGSFTSSDSGSSDSFGGGDSGGGGGAGGF